MPFCSRNHTIVSSQSSVSSFLQLFSHSGSKTINLFAYFVSCTQVIVLQFAICNFIILVNVRAVGVYIPSLTTAGAAGHVPGDLPSEASRMPVSAVDDGEQPTEQQGSNGHGSRLSPSLVQAASTQQHSGGQL